MKRPALLGLAALLATALACDSAEAPKPAPPEPTPKVQEPAPTPKEVEGLVDFSNPKAQLKTRYPASGIGTEGGCDAAGCTWTFALLDDAGANREDARVSFFFPAEAPGVEALQEEHVPKLFAQHEDWSKNGTAGGNAAQPWLRQVTSFNDGPDHVGRIMVGESKTGTFVVTEQIALADLEAIRPMLGAIYANLVFER